MSLDFMTSYITSYTHTLIVFNQKVPAMDYDMLFKFILIGNSNVGKSCLLLRFLEGRFKNQHEPTLGVQFGSKMLHVGSEKIKLQIWDTAGQESFKSITRAYYKGSIGALLVFDLSQQSSFQSLKSWLNQLKTHSHPKIRLMLIGNKADLKEERQVSEEDIATFVKQNKIGHYFEVSALSGVNVDSPFFQLANLIVEAIKAGDLKPEEESSNGIKTKNGPYKRPYIKITASELQKKPGLSNCEC